MAANQFRPRLDVIAAAAVVDAATREIRIGEADAAREVAAQCLKTRDGTRAAAEHLALVVAGLGDKSDDQFDPFCSQQAHAVKQLKDAFIEARGAKVREVFEAARRAGRKVRAWAQPKRDKSRTGVASDGLNDGELGPLRANKFIGPVQDVYRRSGAARARAFAKGAGDEVVRRLREREGSHAVAAFRGEVGRIAVDAFRAQLGRTGVDSYTNHYTVVGLEMSGLRAAKQAAHKAAHNATVALRERRESPSAQVFADIERAAAEAADRALQEASRTALVCVSHLESESAPPTDADERAERRRRNRERRQSNNNNETLVSV